MSADLQKQIKDNSTQISEFFNDLNKWTEEQGKQEKRRDKRRAAAKENGSGTANVAEVPPSTKPSGASAKTAKTAPAPQPERPKEPAIKRDKVPMPQYYSNWDKYDVDGELEQLDDEVLQQQSAEREARQAEKDQILDELAVSSTGDRRRTSAARPRVKISVRRSGRRVAPVDLAAPRKEEANRYFAEGRFREAVATYSTALEYLEKYEPPDATSMDAGGGTAGQGPQQEDGTGQETEVIVLKVALLANRALALVKLEEWREAVADCTEALRFDPAHHKATLRRGFALARLKRWSYAVRDLERATAVDPGDAKAAAELQMARRMVAEQTKEARAHAKSLLTDPTREPTMPTRRLVVRVKEAVVSSAPELPQTRKTVAPELRGLAQADAAPASASSADGSGPAAAGTEAGGTAATASKGASSSRQPYIPRSVRMRGRQPAPGQGPDPWPGAGSTVAGPNVPEAAGRGAAPGQLATNFYTFEAQWARLRGRPRDRAALLRRIGAPALPTLFRDSLDSELVAAMADALAAELDSDKGDSCEGADTTSFAAQVLGALSRTPRFDLSLRGLSAQERRLCGQVLAMCAEGPNGGEDLVALRQAYSSPPLPSAEELDTNGQRPEVAETPAPPAVQATVFSLDSCD